MRDERIENPTGDPAWRSRIPAWVCECALRMQLPRHRDILFPEGRDEPSMIPNRLHVALNVGILTDAFRIAWFDDAWPEMSLVGIMSH